MTINMVCGPYDARIRRMVLVQGIRVFGLRVALLVQGIGRALGVRSSRLICYNQAYCIKVFFIGVPGVTLIG